MTGETPELRSRIMRAVKGCDTGPEMLVRRLAFHMGYRYRLHRVDLPGKPPTMDVHLAFPSPHGGYARSKLFPPVPDAKGFFI